MPKISVIMPVYNAVNYLSTAIDSILNQTFNEFELILVDDGATDGSAEVCEKYAQVDNRIILVHQNNKGICAARNRGVSMAKGDYIAFSDHDDEYAPEYMETLFSLAISSKAEIVKCSVKFYNQKKLGKYEITQDILNDVVYTRQNLIENYFKLPICFFDVWNGMYRKDFLKSSQVFFDEEMLYGQEDFMYNIQLLSCVSYIAMTSKCLYFHYKRLGQSVSAKFKSERLDSMLKFSKMELAILEREVSPNIWGSIYSRLIAKTIAGGVTYISTTSDSLSLTKQVDILKIFCEKLNLKKSLLREVSIKSIINAPKRTLVLVLTIFKQYKFLLFLYKLNNRQNNLLYYLKI